MNVLKRSLLVSVLYGSFAVGAAAEVSKMPAVPAVSSEKAEIENSKQLQELADRFISLADQLLPELQHLAQTTKQFVPADRVGETRQWVVGIVKLVTKLRKQVDRPPIELEKLKKWYRALWKVLEKLNTELDSQFYLLPEVAFEKLLELPKSGAPAPTKQALTAAERKALVAEIEAIERLDMQLIAQVSEKIGRNGISLFNRIYCNLSDFERRTHLAKSTLLVAALTGAVSGIWYLCAPRESMPKSLDLDKRDRVLGYVDSVYDRATKLATISTLALPAIQAGMFTPVIDGTKKVLTAIDDKLRGSAETTYRNDFYVEDPGYTLASSCFDFMRNDLKPLYGVIDYMAHTDRYLYTNARPPRVLLFTGPAGSGKTFLGHALRNSLEEVCGSVAFIEYEEPRFTGLRSALDYAASLGGPALIFIDEVHLLNLQADRSAKDLKGVLETLDEFHRDRGPHWSQVLVVFSTNRPDILESAIFRTGRVDLRIQLQHPSREQRLKILKALCEESGVDFEGIQVDRLVSQTREVSMSTMTALFNHALCLAKERNQAVGFEHLYDGINAVGRNLNRTVRLTPVERHVVSVHMAGMALMHIYPESELESVTIYAQQNRPKERYDFMAKIAQDTEKLFDQRYGNCYTYSDTEYIDTYAETAKDDPFLACKRQIAGLVAQQLILGTETEFRKFQDRTAAFLKALYVVSKGIDLNEIPKQMREEYKRLALEKLEQCEKEVRALLTPLKDQIERLAKALETREFMKVEEVMQVLRDEKSAATTSGVKEVLQKAEPDKV